MATSIVQIRMDPVLRDTASKTFEDLGLDRIERYPVEMIDILLVDAGLLHNVTVGRGES